MFRTATVLNAARKVVARNFSSYQNAQQAATKSFLVAGSIATVGVVAYANYSPISMCAPNYVALRKEIIEMCEKEDERRDDGTSIYGTLVRLAWHASGTYSAKEKNGGSNGSTQRMEPESAWGANAGLHVARDFLAPLAKKYEISSADLWTYAGGVAIEAMGGPHVVWRSGRTDAAKATTVPDGRLPDASKGCPNDTSVHIRQIFNRMGFNDREIVCLSGAHAIGRCHTDASGYWGPWSRSESTFSNEYFKLLLEEKWTIKRTHEGKPWKGPTQFESADGLIMMLPSDMLIIQDPEFRKYAEIYAKDEVLFFKEFALAYAKLLELGVSFPRSSVKV